MDAKKRSELSRQLRKTKIRSRWRKIIGFLACVVVFCTTYALILPAITMENKAYCGMEEHAHGAECYNEAGALLCQLPEHTHSDACFQEDDEEKKEEVHVDSDNTTIYCFEDRTLTVTAELPDDSTVPKDAQLRVNTVTEKDEDYDYASLKEQAQQVLDGKTEEVVFYDISFYVNGENGEEYLPVEDSAKVSFFFKGNVLEQDSGTITVLHYAKEQDEPVELDTVEVQTGANDMLEELTFETEGFSVFAVVKVSANGYQEITVDDSTILDMESFVLVSYTKNKSPSNKETVGDGIKKLDAGGEGADWSGLPLWQFTENADGTYCIGSAGNYMTMENDGKMGLTNVSDSATHFTVTPHNGMALISYNGYYVNNWAGDVGANYFRGYGTGEGDSGSHLRLYKKVDSSQGYELATNLGGQSFAMISNAKDMAITTESILVNGVNGLKSMNVSCMEVDGTTYVVSDDVPQWTFEATSSAGIYHISTLIDGELRYLRLLDTNYAGSVDGRGSLTVGENPQDITVKAQSDGSVCLTVTVDGRTGYINLDGAVNQFWTWNGIDTRSQLRLCKIKSGIIGYDLNLPSLTTVSGTKQWYNNIAPSLNSNIQEVSKLDESQLVLYGKPNNYFEELGFAGELYKEKTGLQDDTQNPFYGLYRMFVNVAGNLVSQDLPTEHMTEEEYMFLGWSYTDALGTKHLFAPESIFTRQEDGSITLPDMSGNQVTISSGEVLTGEWVQISAPVYFFVNHTGTILDTEGDVAGRNESGFLKGTAIGHILFAQDKVGNDGTYALAVHNTISGMFRSKENINLEISSTGVIPEPQIVIETATTATGENLALRNDDSYGEANAKIILEATLSWIRTQSDTDLYISTGNGATRANNDQLTVDNYSVRWYVAKEQYDAWHIDGVLTAKTKPLVVTKSFAGLEEEQIQILLQNYAIDLWIRGNNDTATYMTLNTTDNYVDEAGNLCYGTAGQYTYDGYDSASQTARWTLRLLADEHVTLNEKYCDVNDYITSSYSVIDGEAESIYSGTATGYDISQQENNDAYDVVGGKNGEVSFSNTYTEKGKGSLSILKKNSATGKIIQNVEFILTDQEGHTRTDITDASGRADFMNLEPGSYELTENTPDGYRQLTSTFTVIVSEPDDATGEATVIVVEKNAEGQEVGRKTNINSLLYIIENEPDENTLIVEKIFKDITKEEVRTLSDHYQITLMDTSSSTDLAVLDLKIASYKSADGLRYEWMVKDIGTREIKVTESEYASAAYIDTSVTARVTIGDTVTELQPTIIKSGDPDVSATASVEILTDGTVLNVVSLTNTYTDEFSLYLKKTDTITGQPLQGAEFKLYGSYDEATNAKDTVKYYDSEGNIQTLYYIGNTEPSDENGMALVKGLKLSDEGKTYAYILSEYIAPDGYVKPSYPGGIIPNNQVISVRLDNINNNVYSTSMVNQTMGAPLIVKKEVPDHKLESTNSYHMTITISAMEESIRLENRQYEYQIYNGDGTEAGGLETKKGDEPTGVLNIDTVTFEVDLSDGQYVVVKDVPVGYSYQVQEAYSNSYYCAMDNRNGTGVYDNHNCKITGTILQVPDEIEDTADEGYDQNVEDRKLNTVTVSNYAVSEIADAKTDITVTKIWKVPGGESGGAVVMRLYRVTNGDLEHAVLLESNGEITLSSENSWQGTWTDLPLFNNNGSERYDYYVSEVPVDGYSQSYEGSAGEGVSLQADGEKVIAVHATNSSVTVTNTSGVELPESGGMGNLPFAVGGLLIIQGCLLYGYQLRRKRERRGSS